MPISLRGLTEGPYSKRIRTHIYMYIYIENLFNKTERSFVASPQSKDCNGVFGDL